MENYWLGVINMKNNHIYNKRNISIDIIRIFAILFVVLCHSNFWGCLSYLWVKIFLDTVGNFGTPFFFMISGFLLLTKKYDTKSTKKFYLKNLLPLILCWEIWIIIYNSILFAINGVFVGWFEFCKQLFLFFPVGVDNAWYMPCIIILYTFFPFIANGLNDINFKITIIITSVLFVFYFLLPAITKIESIFALYFNFTYLLYVILGFIAHHYTSVLENKRKSICSLINFLFFLTLFISDILCKRFINIKYNNWYLTEVFVPITSFFLFSFIYIACINIKSNKLTLRMSDCCFGVYLIHIVVILMLNKFLMPKINLSVYPFLAWFISSIAGFAITFALSYVPYFGNILLRTRFGSKYKINFTKNKTSAAK